MSEKLIITNEKRQYWLGREIARGTFGVIRTCRDEMGNRCVAKVLLNDKRSYKTLKWRFLLEVNCMKLLRHPNILYLYDAFEHKRDFYMILERCDITLEDYLKQRAVKNRDTFLKNFAPAILRAVDFIHSQKYVHKDIHAGNIYLRNIARGIDAQNICLGDLGIATSLVDYKREKSILLKHLKPPEFIAPSYFGILDERSDIYQLGLLFLSIVNANSKKYSHQEIIDGLPKKDLLQIETNYKEQIKSMLIRSTEDRASSVLEVYRNFTEFNHNKI